jgi:hypothetical protein
VVNTEPTPDIIAGALTNAKTLIQKQHFGLFQALAEATTTEQSRGVMGFKVFRDTRAAITKVLPPTTTLPAFNDTATQKQLVAVLNKAIKAVMP